MDAYLDGRALDDVAIDRLQKFEEDAIAMNPDGYVLMYSGGKDSEVVWALMEEAGVKYTVRHNLTTADPPELIRHIKKHHPDAEIVLPPETMWQLIRRKGFLPRRNVRYCCEVLKERGGEGSICVTGVRWGESNRRSKRRMIESCFRTKGKKYLHPIIDWTTTQVWQYIRGNNLPYCSLYDEGFRRVGCVLCPMAGAAQAEKEAERWPRLAAAWKRAAYAIYDPDKKTATGNGFLSPKAYWQWWMARLSSRTDFSSPVLFEDDPSFTEATP